MDVAKYDFMGPKKALAQACEGPDAEAAQGQYMDALLATPKDKAVKAEFTVNESDIKIGSSGFTLQDCANLEMHLAGVVKEIAESDNPKVLESLSQGQVATLQYALSQHFGKNKISITGELDPKTIDGLVGYAETYSDPVEASPWELGSGFVQSLGAQVKASGLSPDIMKELNERAGNTAAPSVQPSAGSPSPLG